MRQETQDTKSYGSPHGYIGIERPYFYTDHIRMGDTPFEQETQMDVHRLTLMTHYLLLRKLFENGPQACAEAMKEEYGLNMGSSCLIIWWMDFWKGGALYQDIKQELIQEAQKETGALGGFLLHSKPPQRKWRSNRADAFP